MNEDNRNRNTSSFSSRNTYYNLNLPEWRCEKCGKFNQREDRFCRSCGEPNPVTGPMTVSNGIYIAEMPQKKGSVLKWVAIVTAIIIVVAAVAFAVAKLIMPKVKPTSPPVNNEEQTVSGEGSSTDNGSATNIGEESGTETANSLRYVVGDTYKVQSKEGLKVREGPGKNYKQLRRAELIGDEYDQSLNGGGEYAALKDGSIVTCQEMSDDGNWMRINSGWICVYDGNEYLVIKY